MNDPGKASDGIFSSHSRTKPFRRKGIVMTSSPFRIVLRCLPLVSAGALAAIEGTMRRSHRDGKSTANAGRRPDTGLPTWLPSWISIQQSYMTQMESSKAYDHDPNDFDYYVANPTVDDLYVLLQKFDRDGLEVWPWIWTHPNDNGPHHVFVGTTTLSSDMVHRIQELRKASPQNNILIVISGDESSLQNAARNAGVDINVFDECHCGIVTGVNLQLLDIRNKILMLDDERVIAFDYLTIC